MTSSGRAGVYAGSAVWIAAAITACASFAYRMPQPPGYHSFADARLLFGIPNFTNVVSNLAFAVVGGIALAGLAGRDVLPAFSDAREKSMFRVFFGAAILVAAGSTAYHLSPSNGTLFWDRLPMVVCLAAFAGGLASGRLGARAGMRVFMLLFAVLPATLVYWLWSETLGAGNVWPYLCWMYGSLGTTALMMMLFPPRYTRSPHEWMALGLFAVAMLFDSLLDGWLYSMGRVMGGHALKHVLAALAMYWLWRGSLRVRKVLE
jgi:hypothetical protein